MTEERDRLAAAVLEDGECIAIEAGHFGAVVILHGRAQDDQPRLRVKRRLLRRCGGRPRRNKGGGRESEGHWADCGPGASCS